MDFIPGSVLAFLYSLQVSFVDGLGLRDFGNPFHQPCFLVFPLLCKPLPSVTPQITHLSLVNSILCSWKMNSQEMQARYEWNGEEGILNIGLLTFPVVL